MEEPRISILRHFPDERPAGDVEINVLRVLIVAQEGLRVFPAIEATDVADGSGDDGLEGFGLAVTPVSALDVSGLDLTAMVDDCTGVIDEGLRQD